MKFRRLISTAFAAAVVGIGASAAQAAPGYATANVNIRTGPDTEYPSVGVIPEGTPVDVGGCLRDESWCDVGWGTERGWVFSEYLALNYRGEMTPLPDVGLSGFRIPVVTFRAGDYWKRYYNGRPWYKDRDRWVAFKPRPRAGWHAPPPGARKPGWWRSGYRAPAGMGPPPDRGWRRPDRPDRHDRR
ncbi:MAG: SH3 domain-containing protein [Hyphomicrobiaceae bacterium]